ncbi:YjhT family mutarotase [Vibrio aquaticus]|uniref:YjhT family mutarotase n=1 Tax=Vibrio aquaticus TaxID=2496559 RepID=A0A3S0V500_9VIBR|nr:YjhT family mutarotase [Vibrio aquaticus]RTZ18029.1 YjhT family mutarotase [Vibrio aquaticus]
MILNEFSSLPSGFKNGFSSIINDVLYIGLGSLGARCYSLNLSRENATWERCIDFPYGNISNPVSAQCGNSLWLFGGVVDGQMNEVVYQYDSKEAVWLSYNSPCPAGLLGSVAHAQSDNEVIFVGGYSKPVFDDFSRQISLLDPEEKALALRGFLSQPIEYYNWNRKIWKFNIEYKAWTVLADNPYLATCGSASFEVDGELWVLDGEIKPGLRVSQVNAFNLVGGCNTSRSFESIARSDREHEGLAGAFSGVVNGHPVICGGAYFIGSQENYRAGKLYTHEGLSKTYCCNTWVWTEERWQQLKNLPLGLAYGCSEVYRDKMLVIGGEKSDGSASNQCFEIELE